MKTVCKPNQCAGCKACIDICKKNAISIMDSLSHLNAAIDEKKCINCGACEKVCPNNNIVEKTKPQEWHQGWVELLDKLLHRWSSGRTLAVIL